MDRQRDKREDNEKGNERCDESFKTRKEEQKIERLRDAIEAGENSGYVDNFNPNEHLEELNRKYSK